MIAILLISFILLLAPEPADAQRCAGTVNFVIAEQESGRAGGKNLVFTPACPEPYLAAMTSSDGRYRIEAWALRTVMGGEKVDEGRFSVMPRVPYIGLSTGCGGDFDLFVIRRGASGKPGPDTMAIRLINACDADFGLDLTYVPGRYTLVVCDTTRIPVAPDVSLEGYVYRSLNEQYPSTRHAGYDLTDAWRQVVAGRRVKE